jgi:GPH family glycoside/pentoside/hexuronide:cation symporter
MTQSSAAGAAAIARLSLPRVLAYGVFGLPLAFAALPIYIHLPRLYGEFLAMPLTVLGAILLMARLVDAFIDPLLGSFSDRWQRARPLSGRRSLILLTLPAFGLGVWLLLNPPRGAGVAWLSGTLALTYLGFSLLTITYQAWGADLAASTDNRSRLTASREGFGLVGVMLAATLPTWLSPELPRGLALLALLFVPLLSASALVSVLGTRGMASQMPAASTNTDPTPSVWHNLRATLAHRALRRLLIVFTVSGIAAALSATLVMFFVADVLGAPDQSGAFLATYFAAGLCGLPLWVRWARWRGTLVAWRDGMLLACLAFSAAPFLGLGDTTAFFVICVLSGLALGADLVLPSTHLAELSARSPRATATYFGVWNFATKLNLALAAGIALPLLAAVGYAPGNTEPTNNVAALALFYGGLPLLGKLMAVTLLYRWQGQFDTAPG